MAKRNGRLVWEGPSAFDDGDPVVVLATGFGRPSSNWKTGQMVQTWILPKHGQAKPAPSNCDGCPLRHGTCYVNWWQAPRQVLESHRREPYPGMTTLDLFKAKPKAIRLGAAGDPTAVPFRIWSDIVNALPQWTGYTHQWRADRFQIFKSILMASVDTPEEQRQAAAMGWRTFRIRLPREPVHEDEIVCPASNEGGHKTQCANCKLCAGTSTKAKNIVTVVHGSKGKVKAYKKFRGISIKQI